jgi:hypothetical protein
MLHAAHEPRARIGEGPTEIEDQVHQGSALSGRAEAMRRPGV